MNVFPILAYCDASGAIEWLREALGFEERLVVRDGAGTIVHAELTLDGGTVLLTSARRSEPRHRSPWELGAVTGSTYLHVEDVDARYERAKAAGVVMVRELAGTDYGSREFSARDPEGHLWHFGTYLPGRDT